MENTVIFYRSLRESSETWEKIRSSYIKGYAFLGNNLLSHEELLDYIINAIRESDLDTALLHLNGNYAAIVCHESGVFLISDKVRSFPILYTIRDKIVYCSDSGESAINMMRQSTISISAKKEFAALGYLSGGLTLIDGLFYVPAGEYVRIQQGSIVAHINYHSFWGKKTKMTNKELFDASFSAIKQSFKRMLISLGSFSKILIPLSGGYDSRLIACLCKQAGVRNVLCYTYGKPDSFEVKASKQVAEALGFEWRFVEYNQEVWDQTLNSVLFNQYSLFSGCLSGTPHFQDLPALLQLKQEGVIDSDTVVIPGHSGDLIGGSKIPVELIENGGRTVNSRRIADLIYNHFFDLNELNAADIQTEKEKILYVLGLRDNDVLSLDNALDKIECEWLIKTRIANFIVNSVRAYEFLGMRWRVPLWDSEYASIWYQIPWKMKFNSSLYNRFMFECFFREYNVAYNKKKRSVNKLIKTCFKRCLPPRIKAFYRNYVAIRYSSRNNSNYNAFEFVVSNLERKLTKEDFSFVRRRNLSNINASMSLYYMKLIRSGL